MFNLRFHRASMKKGYFKVIKFVIFMFCFFISVFVHAVDDDVDYIDMLLEQDDIEVDCSNILEVVNSYVDLSEYNQNLLGVSARRFLSALDLFYRAQTQPEIEDVKMQIDDIRGDVEALVTESVVLSNKADAFIEALPDCLQQ